MSSPSVPTLAGARSLEDINKILNDLEQYLKLNAAATLVNLKPGPTPTTLRDGDVWMEAGGLFYYLGGIVGPL